jgi:shikimate dehydrogenase
VAGVIGDPVRHSLSPVLHNAAFAALGLDWVYLAFAVPARELPAALAGIRALGVDGLSVTMPHKGAVAAGVDRLSPTAARLGSANTVVRRGGDLVAESTDGDGFLAALRLDEGWEPAGRRCLVLGTGGAARALVLALGQAGAAQVSVVGRRAEQAQATAALAGPAGRVAGTDDVVDADLVVNATPVGMAGVVGLDGGRVPPAVPFDLDGERLGAGQLVVDLVYAPALTPLLERARRGGARTANGLGMLIHQAALQFRLWTGEDPPLEVMSAAAMSALVRTEAGPAVHTS